MAKTGGNSKRKRKTKNYSEFVKTRNKERRTERHTKWVNEAMIGKRRRITNKLRNNNALLGDEATVTIKVLRKRLYPFTKHHPVLKWSELLKEQLVEIKKGLG